MDLSVLPPSSPPSMTTDSTQSSPSSMNTEPYHQPLPSWRQMKPVSSWLSSRTMKRHRDDRPSEETIHNNTMHKLYEAQKHPEAAEAIMVNTEDLVGDLDMTDEPEILVPSASLEPEPDQPSILNFFRRQLPPQQPRMAEQHISTQGTIERGSPSFNTATLPNTPNTTLKRQHCPGPVPQREQLWNAFEQLTGNW